MRQVAVEILHAFSLYSSPPFFLTGKKNASLSLCLHVKEKGP